MFPKMSIVFVKRFLFVLILIFCYLFIEIELICYIIAFKLISKQSLFNSCHSQLRFVSSISFFGIHDFNYLILKYDR